MVKLINVKVLGNIWLKCGQKCLFFYLFTLSLIKMGYFLRNLFKITNSKFIYKINLENVLFQIKMSLNV